MMHWFPRAGRQIGGAATAMLLALFLGLSGAAGAASSPVGSPGTPPPAPITSNYERATGGTLSRDCGFSSPVPGTQDESIWLFCDTAGYSSTGALTSLILGRNTAAIGPYTPGEVPNSLSEIPTPPAPLTIPNNNGPQPFMPVPTGLSLPNSSSPCVTQPGGVYPASWFTGVAATEGHLLISFSSVCVDVHNSNPFTDEGFGLVTYNPATNTLGTPVEVFHSIGGTTIPAPEQLGSPLFFGGHLYLFGYSCDSAAFGACVNGRIFMARVRANPSAWNTPADYQFWTGRGWSNQAANAGTLIPGATPFGVSVGNYKADGHGLVLIDETTLGGAFQVWNTRNPSGPWRLLQTGQLPGTCSGGEFGCYALNGHPELSTSSDLLLSYYDPTGEKYGHLYVAAFPWAKSLPR